MPVSKISQIDLPLQKRKLKRFENFQPLNSSEYYHFKELGPEKLKEAYLSSSVIVTERTIVVDGPVYLFDITGFAYFHELYDKVLQFEFIKNYIPDIRIVPITYTDIYKKKEASVWLDFFSIYEINEDDVVLLTQESDYVFAEVYNFLFEHNHVMSPFKESPFVWEGFDPWAEPEAYQNYIEVSSLSFKSRISKYMSFQQSKKIFISRKKINDISRGPKAYNSDFFYSVRFITEKNEAALEDFFRGCGYEVVIAEDLSLIEQIKLYSSATHVSGIISSGFCNIIFCSPGTQIMPINLDDTMRVWYDSFSQYFGLRYLEIPGRLLPSSMSPAQMTVFPHTIIDSHTTSHSTEYDFDKIMAVLRDSVHKTIL
jgi:hypothetical protein